MRKNTAIMPDDIEIITSELTDSYLRFQNAPTPENKTALTSSMLKVSGLYAREGLEKDFGRIVVQLIKLDPTEETAASLAENFFILSQRIRNKILHQPEILDTLFTLMLELKIKPGDKNYVFLYKSIHRFRRLWKGYIDFCRWWNFENFSSDDYVIEPGSKMSLAESAMIFYTKRLIVTDFDEDLAKLAATFIKKLSKYPLTVYSNYYTAKLLIRLKYDNDLIRSILRPFAIQKPLKPWTWHLMSKTFKSDTDFSDKYSCLLLALCFGKNFPPAVTNDIYLDLALMFNNLNKVTHAKFFFEIFLKIRREAGFKIPDFVKKITRQRWYITTSAVRPDTSLDYKENCRNILRRTPMPEAAVYEALRQDLETRFPESIQWSKEWYDTMNDDERLF